MEIVVKTLSEKGLENRDYRAALEITINGKLAFSVADGEPEDSNLSRDFNDCYSIPTLMKRAYEAGKAGEEFNLTEIEADEF